MKTNLRHKTINNRTHRQAIGQCILLPKTETLDTARNQNNMALLKNAGPPHSGGHFHTFQKKTAQNTSIQGVLPSLRHKLDGSWN